MSYENMSGPDLVRAFNEMAAALNVKTVSRFADATAGRRRCEALASRLRARESGLAEEAEQAEAPRRRKRAVQRDLPIDIFAEFKTNTGKNRGKLLSWLNDHMGQQVALKRLVQHVYGRDSAESDGALKMIIRGLQLSIQKDRLKYELRKSKLENGGLSYGLYRKT